MERIGIYKNLVVTYSEFENALLRLGFRQTVKEGWKIYIHDEHGAVVRINPLNTPDHNMHIGAFAAEAYNLEMMGVLEDRDEIAKMIEQTRLGILSKDLRSVSFLGASGDGTPARSGTATRFEALA